MYEQMDLKDTYLMHYGVKRRSGRYPWGSGDQPYQHSGDFLSRIESLEKDGISEKDIAKSMGMTTTDLRLYRRYAAHERRQLEADRARSLREDGKSLNEIAEIMGYKNDSSIRALLNQNTADNKNKARVTADILKEHLETKDMIDVGAGVEKELGISRQKLDEAIMILENEGYNRYGIGLSQVTNPGKQTITTVLTKSDISYGDVYKNVGDIQSVAEYHSEDGGESFRKREYPSSIDSNRVQIRYAEEGGLAKDGVMEIRRGCKDLDLGSNHYAQVRIMVDGTHYLKGMAIYSDNLPDGVDVMFNTNKTVGTDKMDVLKKIKNDPTNPFGAEYTAAGQSYYKDPNGKFKNPITGERESLNAINKLKMEGDWDDMSRTLSSQFLSKQPQKLIDSQLKLTYADHNSEYEEIKALTNPTIKRKLLLDFANNCEAAATDLKASALPRQSTQVILPINNIKDTEVYAPNYKNGEQVALIRYPHAGTFEIPILTVNNKNKEGKEFLGNIRDAVGINSNVAQRLSGADFDGDQVVVIPVNSKVNIKSTPAFKEMLDYDAKTEYAIPKNVKSKISKMQDNGLSEKEICKAIKKEDGISIMTKSQTQKQMGIVSNLITDMTLRGATKEEMIRAVKHSQTVIDAEKHKLDYKRSEKENGIEELRQKYQKRVDEDGNIKYGGASTLLSKRKQTVEVNERKGSARIDKETGELIYKESGRTYVDKNGDVKIAKTKEKLILNTPDVRSLSSGTPQENAYADYSNKMKALANEARKEAMATGRLTYDPQAAKTYAHEVKELNSALTIASTNAPKERRALAIANSVVRAKVQSNPDLAKDKKELGKVRNQAMNDARDQVGASGKQTRINITDKQWEAIQAGAISDSKLSQILRYADQDVVRQKATPRNAKEVSDAKVSRMKQMANLGYTNAEIAEKMGLSASTVGKYVAD